MVAAHPSDLAAAAEAGLRTAYVPRPLEHGPGGFRAAPAEQRFDFVAAGLRRSRGAARRVTVPSRIALQ